MDNYIDFYLNREDYCSYSGAYLCQEKETISNFCIWCKYRRDVDIPRLIRERGEERMRISEPGSWFAE